MRVYNQNIPDGLRYRFERVMRPNGFRQVILNGQLRTLLTFSLRTVPGHTKVNNTKGTPHYEIPG